MTSTTRLVIQGASISMDPVEAKVQSIKPFKNLKEPADLNLDEDL